MDVFDEKPVLLQFGDDVSDAGRLVVYGFAENERGHLIPHVFLVVEFAGGSDFDAVVDAVQNLVENGKLVQIAAVVALVELVDVDFPAGVFVVGEKEAGHLFELNVYFSIGHLFRGTTTPTMAAKLNGDFGPCRQTINHIILH